MGVARSVAAQQPQPCRPVPNEGLLGDPGEFVNFLSVKGLVSRGEPLTPAGVRGWPDARD